MRESKPKNRPVSARHGSNLRCIMCGAEKGGLPVKEDYIIKAIRLFKTNVTKNAKNYDLVVCREDYTKYSKARESYIKKQLSYITLGIVTALVLFFVSGFEFLALSYGIIIVLFTYAISLFSYIPGVDMPSDMKPTKK